MYWNLLYSEVGQRRRERSTSKVIEIIQSPVSTGTKRKGNDVIFHEKGLFTVLIWWSIRSVDRGGGSGKVSHTQRVCYPHPTRNPEQDAYPV